MNDPEDSLNPSSLLARPSWGFGEVLRLCWPASLTMLNVTLMRFVDGWMVSLVGPNELSAQFVGGQASFVFESFLLGVLAVVNTFASQNLGARRYERCADYAWSGLAVAAVFSLLAAPLVLAAGPIFDLLIQPASAPVRPLAAMYFRYMVAGIFLSQGASVFQRFFYGIHRPTVVFLVSLVCNAFNVLANYVLIFGKFGFPKLGLEGAAIGTVAGMGLMMLILAAWFLSPHIHATFRTRRPRVRLADCRDLFRVGLPAGVQFTNDLISWSILTSVLVGGLGEAHLAASSIAVRYMSLSFMPAVGIGIATTSLVGRYIGEGLPAVARKRTHAGFLIAMTYMVICAGAFYAFRGRLVDFFVTVTPSANLSPAQAAALEADIIRFGGRILVCAAVFQLFDALGIVFIGALRGAGDTLWVMIVTILLSWTCILGGGWLAVRFVPELTSLGPWIAASSYVIIVGVLVAWRFETGAWRKIDLLGKASPVEGGT